MTIIAEVSWRVEVRQTFIRKGRFNAISLIAIQPHLVDRYEVSSQIF